MFNLEQAIAEWRRRMQAAGIKAPEPLDELEGHLGEEIEEQMRSGLDAQSAFGVALERIGQPGALGAEFAKVGPTRRTGRARYLRVACFLSAPLALLSGAWAFLESGMNPSERLQGFLAIGMTALCLSSLPVLHGLVPRVYRGAGRKAVYAAFILMQVWAGVAFVGSLQMGHAGVGAIWCVTFWWLVASLLTTELARDALGWDGVIESLGPFTPMAQRSVEIAREEACAFYHDFIGTEHLLLGVISLEDGTVAKALNAMGVEREAVRAEIEKVVGPGSEHRIPSTLPYTPRCRRALELAAREAKALKQGSVSAEIIFLGLVLEGSGVAAKVLKNLGVNAESAREEVRKRTRAGERG